MTWTAFGILAMFIWPAPSSQLRYHHRPSVTRHKISLIFSCIILHISMTQHILLVVNKVINGNENGEHCQMCPNISYLIHLVGTLTKLCPCPRSHKSTNSSSEANVQCVFCELRFSMTKNQKKLFQKWKAKAAS